MKRARDEIGIKRRLPRGSSRMRVKWIAEPVPGSDSFANAPHLPAKAKVVVDGFELVSVADDNPAHAQQKRDREYPELRGSNTRPKSHQRAKFAFIHLRIGIKRAHLVKEDDTARLTNPRLNESADSSAPQPPP